MGYGKNKEKKMPELGIKETQELIGALLELGSELKEQSADGKIDIGEIFADFPEIGKVINESRDIDKIMDEMKDLDEDEIRAINTDLITLVFQIVTIIKNLK